MNSSSPPRTVIVTGCSPAATNLGLGALFASISALVGEAAPGTRILNLEYDAGDAAPASPTIPLRFSRNLLLPNNVGSLLLRLLLLQLVPSRRLRQRWARRSETLARIMDCDMALAVTGGDSFSDIYGFWNYLYSTLPLLVIILSGCPLVLLPQTYGPFRTPYARLVARFILSRATSVAARDEESREVVEGLIGPARASRLFRSAPDLAFRLDPGPPPPTLAARLPQPAGGEFLLGINVSGLLLMGGYSGKNQFSLVSDYRDLVSRLLPFVLENPRVRVIMVPHVLGEHPESDPPAILEIYRLLPPHLQRRVTVIDPPLDARQAKWIIGRCHLFVGSRMHACIAALSQGVPAIGLAYSRKFVGVFGKVGAGNLAVDLRKVDIETALETISGAMRDRAHWQAVLAPAADTARRELSLLFRGILP